MAEKERKSLAKNKYLHKELYFIGGDDLTKDERNESTLPEMRRRV